METSMADAVGRLTQTTRTQTRPQASLAKVRTRLEEKGFLSSVAGSEEFERVCEAVKAAHDADRGLLLIGKCGRGKTHLMKALYALNYGREARWLYVKDGRHLNWMKDAPGFFMDKNQKPYLPYCISTNRIYTRMSMTMQQS